MKYRFSVKAATAALFAAASIKALYESLSHFAAGPDCFPKARPANLLIDRLSRETDPHLNLKFSPRVHPGLLGEARIIRAAINAIG
ncbi:MAG: hypothetical protein AAGB46_05660, partial [Verrucomicrobiota bacterium]